VHRARAVATTLLAQHPRIAEQHVARWLGGKAEYLKA
jgi:ATP-dependent DNA helicase RecG